MVKGSVRTRIWQVSLYRMVDDELCVRYRRFLALHTVPKEWYLAILNSFRAALWPRMARGITYEPDCYTRCELCDGVDQE